MDNLLGELETIGFGTYPIRRILENFPLSKKMTTQAYYVIAIVHQDVEVAVEGKRYSVDGGSLLFLSPYKRVELLDETAAADVHVFVFSNIFYELSDRDSFVLNSSLFYGDENVSITSSRYTLADIEKYFIEALDECKPKSKDLYIYLAHNCIERLILEGLHFSQEYLTTTKNVNLSDIAMVNRFRVLLQKYFKREREVSFYADKLGVTPQALTLITNKVLNKGAKECIIEKIVAESVRMLKYSTKNISEIVYEMNFSDKGNFSSFIRKHTGYTPSDMRNRMKLNDGSINIKGSRATLYDGVK